MSTALLTQTKENLLATLTPEELKELVLSLAKESLLNSSMSDFYNPLEKGILQGLLDYRNGHYEETLPDEEVDIENAILKMKKRKKDV
jgi:hypothetical protein